MPDDFHKHDDASLEENPLPCHEKIAFPNAEQAEAAAAVDAYWHGTKLKAYKCRYCDMWHLSSH